MWRLPGIQTAFMSVRSRGQKFSVSKYKIFKYTHKFTGKVAVAETMGGTDFIIYSLMKDPSQDVTFSTLPLYTNTLPIKSEKVENLKRLVKYLSPAGAAFYSSLTGFSQPEVTAMESGEEEETS